jgi:outer membrane receptor protein involved in Fe transport
MKILILTSIFLSFLINTNAQIPGGRGGGQSMNVGHAYGKILDTKTGKGLEAVSIQILQTKMDTTTKTKKEMVIAGQLTQSNGDFSIEGLPVGPSLTVKISAIGYTTVEKKLQFTIDMNAMKSGDMMAMLNNVDKDLGNIKLAFNVKVGEVVTVTGERSSLQLGIDRKIFNVEKNIVSAGGTGVDIMRNVPSVQVDIDGNVTLRNNTPQLFIDGRPTPLTLEQIPSDAIASVELITNPSAKFDASGGTSGIINIVLKKNRKVGYNGTLRTNIDSRAKVGAGADINVRQNKVNVFASVNYNQRKSIGEGKSDRTNYFDTPQTTITQRNNNNSVGSFRFFRAGLDYFIDNRNTFSVSSNIVRGGFNPYETIDIYQSSIGVVNSAYRSYRVTEGTNKFKNNGITVSFKHLFTKPSQEITADITFNKSKNYNNSDFTTSPLTNNINDKTLQQIRANGGRQNVTMQTDYTQPLSKNGKLEFGARFNQGKVFSLNDNYIQLPYTNTLQYIAALGYNFETVENVYAAYTTIAQKINKTNIQAGLRWESSNYNGNLISKNQTFNNKFPNSFFPSLFITQNVGKGQDLQLNYTRKINRPNFFQLLPFVDYADSLNITRGNPGLVPEFTNSVELSYQLPYGKTSSLLISTYYKNTENLIARYQNKEVIATKDVIVNSYINANSSTVYGIELTNKNNLTSWWDVTTNINFYGSKLNIPGLPIIENKLSAFGKLNSNMKFPKNITIQISGEFQSKSVLPPGGNSSGGGGGRGMGMGMGGGGFGGGGQGTSTQGYIKSNYGIDLAFKRDFWKDKKASISLSVNDIFRTKINWVHTETTLLLQDAWRLRDPQVFRLSFSYKFGKFDASLFKRKNMKGEGEGMRGGMEGM